MKFLFALIGSVSAVTLKVSKTLEAEADYPQNVMYAQSNLMNAYYQTEDYTSAENYAEKVLANSNLDTKVKSDAKIIFDRF